MGKRYQLYALGVVAAVCVLVLLGVIFLDVSGPTAPDTAPEKHNIEANAPHEVQNPPPGALGTADKP